MGSDLAIASIRHWVVYVPLRQPLAWSSGLREGSTRLICEVTTAGGVKGYGETICLHDFVPAVFEKVVVPIARRLEVSEAERLWRHAEGAGYYHHKRALVFAASALEMAMWDALGRHAGLGLHQLWGGAYRRELELCAYVYLADPAAAAAELAACQEEGYSSFKLKIGSGPAEDLALVAAARKQLGPAAQLRVDPNGAWTPATAKRMLEKLRPYDLQYVEQPLIVEDLVGLAQLRRASPVPICIDEGAYTLQETLAAIRLGAADYVLVDPHEAGGLWQCLKTAAVAEAAGIHVGFHSGGELGLTQAANLQLAASMPNATVALDTIYQHHEDDVLAERIPFEGGRAALPAGPGLGVEVDLDRVEKLATDEIRGAYLNPSQPAWFAEKPAY